MPRASGRQLYPREPANTHRFHQLPDRRGAPGFAGRAAEADCLQHRRTDPRRRNHADGHRRDPGRGAAVLERQEGPGRPHRAVLRWRDRSDRNRGHRPMLPRRSTAASAWPDSRGLTAVVRTTWTTTPCSSSIRRTYVNDPFVIAQNTKQIAINSALEVDLTGQVCAIRSARCSTVALAGNLTSCTARLRSAGRTCRSSRCRPRPADGAIGAALPRC